MDMIILRGGGDIATGIAHRLYQSGFHVVISEIEKPTAIRRRVSFCEAIYSGEIEVEGVKAVLSTKGEVLENLKLGVLPVVIDENCSLAYDLKPLAVIDSILAKKNLGTKKDMAPITVGVGPGFSAGGDVDLVVETNRGHHLGKVIDKGKAMDNTGIPGTIQGYTAERVVRASAEGQVKT